jgi:hypothetical protein
MLPLKAVRFHKYGRSGSAAPSSVKEHNDCGLGMTMACPLREWELPADGVRAFSAVANAGRPTRQGRRPVGG